MISTLHIKNIGIIEDLTVDLNTGFNVLTGETGAGKTLIIDSLNLACGGRFSKEIVRRGENFCLVELNIYLPQNENSIDGNIIISREIFLNGRNTCKINGRLVTVNELKEFMSKIIDIHGQNDNQTIMSKQEHINYLDNFIGKDLLNEKYEYQKLYNREPTLKEIAVTLDMDESDILMAMESGQEVCSLHQVIYQSEGDEIHLEDKLEQQADLIEQTVDNIYVQELLKKLNERERQIIHMRYFQNQTQAAIAKKIGISQVQVSRMEKKILNKLRKNANTKEN